MLATGDARIRGDVRPTRRGRHDGWCRVEVVDEALAVDRDVGGPPLAVVVAELESPALGRGASLAATWSVPHGDVIGTIISAMELVLIRHGEPEWVRDGLNVVNPPLTERGQMQAERVGAELGGEHFDEIIVSPLLRARQTAAPLLAAQGRAGNDRAVPGRDP